MPFDGEQVNLVYFIEEKSQNRRYADIWYIESVITRSRKLMQHTHEISTLMNNIIMNWLPVAYTCAHIRTHVPVQCAWCVRH